MDKSSPQSARTKIVLLAALLATARPALADSPTSNRFFLGTSAFVLANLDGSTSEAPNFYQLNVGYQPSERDVVFIEAITWQYHAPLGAPISVSDDDKYPGSVTGLGLGLAYQRFLWKRFYGSMHATWFDQTFEDENGSDIGDGRQLFLTLRAGYRFQPFGDDFFVEPSLAVTHWPVNTGLPDAFEAEESKWRDYQFEPGMHIGFAF